MGKAIITNKMPSAMLEVEIWRGASHTDGHYVRYQVPQRESQTVLDVVTWVQRKLEPTLSYRFACRVGMCGSCAMTVNGRPRWTCRSHVGKMMATDNKLRIGPLRNLPVIKDLVVDMTVFFDKWQQARGRFESAISREDPIVPIEPSSPQRQAADAAIECINCAVCYAACDVVSWNQDYLGPAALNRAWAAYNDSRDNNKGTILQAISAASGCHNCHSQQSCVEHCPVQLNPTASIAGLKQASLKALLSRKSQP